MFDVFYSGIKPNLFAHEREATSIEHAQTLSRTRYFWWVNYLTDYTDFDFLWEPVPWQSQYTHTWPSRWDQFYSACLVPTGAKRLEYHHHTETLPAREYRENFQTLIPCEFDYSWVPHPWDPPYIYVFGNQWWSAVKQPTVEYHAPRATERKYVAYPRAELNVCMDNWTVPDNVDTSTFDFSWRPDPGDPAYIYQFGTQHQRTGGPRYTVTGATDVKYVDQIKIKTGRVASAIIEIDHMDGNAGQIANTNKTVRYFDNYLDTLKRIAKSIPDEHEFVWICSSVCDYTDFDFTWHPEIWQATMLHVFASDGEKFGDTFFMHVPTFKLRSEKLQLLDWYDINFIGPGVPRRPLPVIHHKYDTHVEAVKTSDWPGPLAVFTTNRHVEAVPTVPLWREKTKTIVPLSAGASQVIVPKVAIPYIKTQAYDYPYIDRTQRHMYSDQLLDIVFIDNGEPNADDNYQYLKWAAERAHQPNIHRSSGVNGRVAAYCAAAELSTTPWFFAVFAKLEVSSVFDWTWQPDRLQEPKHYIFHAYNPVNGLEYGHQAMIAYNKKLVLENAAPGLDFTLDQEHEVVPVVSGIANYHYSKWVAWRTAFREVIKLKHSLPDIENEYRLTRWLTALNNVENSEYSIWGAEDAVEYYDAVAGDFTELKKSYDWAWLASYAMIKRNLLPDQ
jgi:hypothetical protein